MLDIQKIKNELSKRNLTVVRFAELLGTSRQSVFNMFNSKKAKSEVIDKMSAILNIPYEDLFVKKNNYITNEPLMPYGDEVAMLKREIEQLKELLKSKETIISLLKDKLEDR